MAPAALSAARAMQARRAAPALPGATGVTAVALRAVTASAIIMYRFKVLILSLFDIYSQAAAVTDHKDSKPPPMRQHFSRAALVFFRRKLKAFLSLRGEISEILLIFADARPLQALNPWNNI